MRAKHGAAEDQQKSKQSGKPEGKVKDRSEWEFNEDKRHEGK